VKFLHLDDSFRLIRHALRKAKLSYFLTQLLISTGYIFESRMFPMAGKLQVPSNRMIHQGLIMFRSGTSLIQASLTARVATMVVNKTSNVNRQNKKGGRQ